MTARSPQDPKPPRDSKHSGALPVAQAGTVPFRRLRGHLELCLITARTTGQWGFPKGNVDPGEREQDTATKETWEEAGVRGELGAEILGYAYVKHGRECSVRMFLLRVDEVLDAWPERHQRQREWVDTEQAKQRIDRHELQPVLDSAIRALNSLCADDR